MKKIFLLFSIVGIILISFFIYSSYTQEVTTETSSSLQRLQGYILLQVEEHGEAFYYYKDENKRYYLGRPADAYSIMRELGLGISNEDIRKIPVGILETYGTDRDGDRLPDTMEDSFGTNINQIDTDNDGFSDYTEIINHFDPLGPGELPIDNDLISRVKGKIVLQVQSYGEAWYIYPKDGKRYYLGRPDDAFKIMRGLGMGISNENLDLISPAAGGPVQYGECGDGVCDYGENTPTYPYYCPEDCGEVACAELGELVYGQSYLGPTKCCNSEHYIKPGSYSFPDNPYFCTGPDDGSSGRCHETWGITCGDGICSEEYDEDKCNCSKDCGRPVCADEGEVVYLDTVPRLVPIECCDSSDYIKPIAQLDPDSNMCIAPTDGSVGTCHSTWGLTCGDGTCDYDTENHCNCREDCILGANCETDNDCGSGYICNTFSNTCWPECYGEGESPSVYPGAPGCCNGLELINPKEEFIVGVSGICTAKCGNGVCDSETESTYNCPEDCQ